jgi:hypothetical protein
MPAFGIATWHCARHAAAVMGPRLISGIAPLLQPPEVVVFWHEKLELNVAVTLRAWVIDTVQVPKPLQAPDQPPNVEPPPATAVSTTDWPLTYGSEQSAPQLTPAGLEVTVPVPVPFRVTSRTYSVGENIAVTDVAAVTVTTHVPLPEQPLPDQAMNVEPGVASAVSVTIWPEVKAAAHVAPQLIPAGLEVTVPLPVPVLFTVRVSWSSVNVAVSAVSAITLTTHVLVPVQTPPDQPVNVEPGVAVGVSVTI